MPFCLALTKVHIGHEEWGSQDDRIKAYVPYPSGFRPELRPGPHPQRVPRINGEAHVTDSDVLRGAVAGESGGTESTTVHGGGGSGGGTAAVV